MGPAGKTLRRQLCHPSQQLLGWVVVVHGPQTLTLWVILCPAVPLWEQLGGEHGLSGRHMPRAGDVGCRGRCRSSAVFPGGDSLGSGCVPPVPPWEAQRELRGSEESHGAGWAPA